MNRHFYLILLFLSLVGFRSGDPRSISGTVYDVDDMGCTFGFISSKDDVNLNLSCANGDIT